MELSFSSSMLTRSLCTARLDSPETWTSSSGNVPFLGRDTFLRNKRAAGRPKDLADIDALEPVATGKCNREPDTGDCRTGPGTYRVSSSTDTVAGPNLPTTIPAARLAIRAASLSGPRGQRQRHGGDHGIAGAGHVRDLARFGGSAVSPSGECSRMPCSPRVISTLSQPVTSRKRRAHSGGFEVGARAHVRDRLGLVMVGRDQRRATVVAGVRDLGIDVTGMPHGAPRPRSPRRRPRVRRRPSGSPRRASR